jgi:hypothetical protein
VNVTTDGKYVLVGGDGRAQLKVTKSGATYGFDATITPTIIALDNTLLDDIPAAQAVDGGSEYWCIFVKNNHGVDTMSAVRLWADLAPSVGEAITLGLDPGGKNSTPDTIADSATAPIGVTFASYTSDVGGLSIGNLSAGDYYPIWVKRTVAAGTNARVANDTMRFCARFQ